MRALLGAVAIAVVVGCGGGGTGTPGQPDTGLGIDAGRIERCEAARTAWRALVAQADRVCGRPQDCEVLGPVASCDCSVHLSENCSGTSVSRNGLNSIRTDLEEHQAVWAAEGCEQLRFELQGTCDCERRPPDCVNNRCTLGDSPSCFPVDAGVTLDAPR